MAGRIPALTRSDGGYDQFSKLSDGMFGPPEKTPFILKRPSDHALVGPMPFIAAQPQAGEALMNLLFSLSKIPGVTPEAKEVVILAVGAKYKAAYELYAHTAVAQQTVGLPKDIVEAIARGERPGNLGEELKIAYDLASYLAGSPGPLPQELWDKSVNAFGKDGTIGFVHYVGAYAYTCIILNAVDTPIPKESD